MFPTIDKHKTGINLRKLMDKRGITAKDVQRYLGLGCVQSVYRWLEGKSMPTIDNLYALSALFQVPIDKIVCGNRTAILPSATLESYKPHGRRLCVYYQKLNILRIA